MNPKNEQVSRPPQKHFMAIGAGPVVRPVPRLQLRPTGNVTGAGSFVISRPEKPLEKFPDIYTTCPELRKMQSAFVTGGITLLRVQQPQIQPQQPSPQPQPQPVTMYQMHPPVMPFNPNALIINPYVFFRFFLSFSKKNLMIIYFLMITYANNRRAIIDSY